MEAPGLTSLGKTCSLDGLANVEVYSLMMSFLGQLAARRLDTLPRGGRAEPNQPGKDVYWGETFRGWLTLKGTPLPLRGNR